MKSEYLLQPNLLLHMSVMPENIEKRKMHLWLTGVCCQWRGSASYDSDVQIETFVLRSKFSGEIATDQQPLTVMGKAKKCTTWM